MSETKPEDYFKLQPILSREQLATVRFVELSMARTYLLKREAYPRGFPTIIIEALEEIDKELFELTREVGTKYLEDFLSRTLGKLDDGPGIKP